jgi:hypothetical protein
VSDENLAREIRDLCLPIYANVMTYAEYTKSKSEILSGCYLLRFPSDLTWLYDADHWRQDLLPAANWEDPYAYVVVLEGPDQTEMSNRAEALIKNYGTVGLVVIRLTKD